MRQGCEMEPLSNVKIKSRRGTRKTAVVVRLHEAGRNQQGCRGCGTQCLRVPRSIYTACIPRIV